MINEHRGRTIPKEEEKKKREKKAKKWDETRRGVKQSQSSSTLSLEEDDILRLDLYTRRSRKKREKNTTHIICMYVVVYNIHIFYTFLSVAYIRRYKRSQ